jgi:hypothetical protein
MHLRYRWRSRPDIAALETQLDALRSELIRLRSDLTHKAGYAATLELVVKQRSQTIDELAGKLEQARAQCRRLDEEAESYAAMVQRGPLRERY